MRLAFEIRRRGRRMPSDPRAAPPWVDEPEAVRERLEERAAIREHEAGMTREEAEALTWDEWADPF